jgi:D-alanyl-D-alanine carboxypeptidase/D-alanyl-D-alanine-endopeptidase (penicillin-binding protein 4)
VVGASDPDFQVENAFLVARELNRLGVRRVTGDIVVIGPFWQGWEQNGSGRKISNPERRRLEMGRRLHRAIDRRRWQSWTWETWRTLCRRRGWNASQPPSVEIGGRVRVDQRNEISPLVEHRSNPLAVTLRRFNVYSNNDISRVAEPLGEAGALSDFLRDRLGAEHQQLELSTPSGLKRNRMTPRIVVRLMREFLATTSAMGLEVDQLLPVIGCDPGSSRRAYPKLARGSRARTVVAKTGTLTTTDGGVVALAGYFTSPTRGVVLFSVGAPGSGWDRRRWREIEQSWLIELMASAGGAIRRSCAPKLPFSDSFAEVVAVNPGQRDETSEFLQHLARHLERHPLAAADDLYKFAHQAVFGPGHFIPNREAAGRYLESELAEMGSATIEEPLCEGLGGTPPLVRIHLRPFLEMGHDPLLLLDAFVDSANGLEGRASDLSVKLNVALKDLAQSDRLALSSSLALLDGELESRGYPALHHSKEYSEAYRPAYRVVLRDIAHDHGWCR